MTSTDGVGKASIPDKPIVSVVTVVDFDYHGGRTRETLHKTLEALADQDFDGPVEFLVCEQAEGADTLRAEIESILPGARVVPVPARDSYSLINAGVRAASADIVGLVDGDCVVSSNWVRDLVDTFAEHPEIVAVSGRTTYGTASRSHRFMALLSRSYLNPGGKKTTRFFSNNNGGMRREVWLRHPLPTDGGPYASRLQTEAIWREGGRFLFHPEMEAVHDYEGWEMERDIRRHHGYSTVHTRLRDSAIPYAWLIRLGRPAIPAIVAAKILGGWADCLRCARYYDVRWYEMPAVLTLGIVVHLMEVPGMMLAFQGRPITDTRYR